MAQGNWAAQQSANDVAATAFTEGALFARGYVPQYTAGTAGGVNEHAILTDAINALLNCVPQSFSVAFTPVATAAASVAEQTLVVNGSNGAVGDRVFVIFPGAPTANVTIGAACRVSTAGVNATISIPFINPTAGSLTAPSGNYIVTFLRS